MRIILSLVTVSLFALDSCDGPGVPTGSHPIRVPAVTVSATVSANMPRCDGSFEGSGRIVANYPAAAPGAGPPATIKIALKVVDKDNVSVTLNPDNLSISGPSDSPAGYNLKGDLTDPCKRGSFRVQATITNTTANPTSQWVESSPVVNIRDVGFKIIAAPDVHMLANGDFKVTVKLGCCGAGGAARRFRLEWKDLVNVPSLTCDPVGATIACPGADVEFVLKGTKQDPEKIATFTLYIHDLAAGGPTCRLGTVQTQ